MLKPLGIITIISAVSILCACNKMPGQYQIDIRQGNYLDERRVEQIRFGMTKEEVQLLIGTTLVNDPYRPEVWNYVYSLQKTSGKAIDYKRLVLGFTDQRVSNIDYLPSTNPDNLNKIVENSDMNEAPKKTFWQKLFRR